MNWFPRWRDCSWLALSVCVCVCCLSQSKTKTSSKNWITGQWCQWHCDALRSTAAQLFKPPMLDCREGHLRLECWPCCCGIWTERQLNKMESVWTSRHSRHWHTSSPSRDRHFRFCSTWQTTAKPIGRTNNYLSYRSTHVFQNQGYFSHAFSGPTCRGWTISPLWFHENGQC